VHSCANNIKDAIRWFQVVMHTASTGAEQATVTYDLIKLSGSNSGCGLCGWLFLLYPYKTTYAPPEDDTERQARQAKIRLDLLD